MLGAPAEYVVSESSPAVAVVGRTAIAQAEQLYEDHLAEREKEAGR